MNEQKGMTSEFAIASAVMGIISFVNLLGLEKALIAIMFGAFALKGMKNQPGLGGKKLAIVGILLGTGAAILMVIIAVRFWPQLQQAQQILSSPR
jgi:hypothetical protein